ncbi:SGNH/GDSL hydrolase family protein [Arsenicicoccus bolidensis]|uniref:SGNH/GDSL hydrolase family protein n=1 Tax=Arsenicicoccus bolidensis TaxID=229480 RepID=A0ABS9Q3A6_9MICO|nr:SGNH/GDSL hydrolase family protein [Arsenicicoccus bolidensis]MCG7322366.1 SGNH/GDSL hydrolase family protein [Arsenicicoccus bolidensis]
MNDHPDDRPGDEPAWLLRSNRGLRRRIRSVGDTVAVHRDAWQRHNSAVLASGVPLWVVLGDSLSQGIGASAWDCGWVHRSLRQVRLHSGSARDLGVVNLSRSGATTHDVLDPQLVELERLLDGGHRVELVSLVVGANDFLRGGARAGLEQRFAAIVDQLPRNTVVAYLPQPLAVARRVNHSLDRAAADGLIQPVSIRRVALLLPRNSAPDLFHPNDRGHELLASSMTPALLRAITRSSTST